MTGPAGRVAVERLTQYSGTDLDDLCEATESAIVEGGGFGWLKAPPRQVLENYWKGVLLVPERATDLHLQILSELAQMFSDKPFRDQLLNAPSADAMHRLIAEWQPNAENQRSAAV